MKISEDHGLTKNPDEEFQERWQFFDPWPPPMAHIALKIAAIYQLSLIAVLIEIERPLQNLDKK